MPHTLLLIFIYSLVCPFNSPSCLANKFLFSKSMWPSTHFQIAPPFRSHLCPASSNLKQSWFLTFLCHLPYNHYFCDHWFTCLFTYSSWAWRFSKVESVSYLFLVDLPSILCVIPGPEQYRHQPDQGRGCWLKERKWICPHGMRPTSGTHMNSSH